MLYTRITNKLMNDNIINNMLVNRSRLNDLQEQITSGKRVRRPSDDPSDAMTALVSRTSINQIDRYIKNINNAQSELDITDKSLQSAVDIVHRASELAVEASNATTGASELTSINDEIKQLMNQARDIANTKYGNKFIFGGLVTEGSAFQTSDYGIEYTGTPSTTTYQREVEIGENTTLALNLPGDQIFGEYYSKPAASPPATALDVEKKSGLLGTLGTLSEELTASPTDYTKIRGKIDELQGNLTTLLDNQAITGGALSRLDMTKGKLEEDQFTFTTTRSNAEDVDMAKTITDLKFQETALEASLQVSAKVIQPSLLNFL